MFVNQETNDRAGEIMRSLIAAATIAAAVCASALPARADDVANAIEQARTAYGRGDLTHSLTALQTATNALYVKLSEQFGKCLPAGPAGWEAAPVESQSLDSIGGGLTVTRGYMKGDATLNASLVVDNPAVAAGGAPFKQAPKPGWSKVKVGNDDALLHFDAPNHSGEIMILVGDRALLQIEGNEIPKEDTLIEAAKGWNIPGIKKLLGI